MFPLDADWVIHGDRDKIRAEPEASDRDEVGSPVQEPLNPTAKLAASRRTSTGITLPHRMAPAHLPRTRRHARREQPLGYPAGDGTDRPRGKQWHSAPVSGRLHADCHPSIAACSVTTSGSSATRNIANRSHQMDFMQESSRAKNRHFNKVECLVEVRRRTRRRNRGSPRRGRPQGPGRSSRSPLPAKSWSSTDETCRRPELV